MKFKILCILIIMSILCGSLPVVNSAEEIASLDASDATILYTEAQYDFVKAKVVLKEEPWYSAYNKMLSLADEWIEEEPSAVEHWYVPGFYTDESGHKEARQTLMNDAKSAYACAVAYKFTGLEKYAQQTIRILDDWTKLKTLGSEDSGLVFSYVGNSLIMSADLVKGYSGWTNKTAFDTWVKDYYLTLANKSWSTGNSGDWNLFARSVGYAYLGDKESLKNIIVGDEDQSGSVKYKISLIREDGILHKELERGSNGLWYSYFALAPLTACCQVLYNNLGEDYFNWQSSQGRSVKKAVETYFYYCNNIDEWNQVYKDYYDGTKTTSAGYPSNLSSTSWPLPLFEAMAGVYNNQDYCDYVGRYRPVYGTINDGIYHHFAWFFPTLMYGSLQLGGGLPEYVAPPQDTHIQVKSDFEKTEYYQNFEGEYTVVNSTTANGRDKYSVMDGENEIYYIEKSSGAYTSDPISFPEDSIYGGKSVNASMSNNAKIVVNLPRTYNAEDGIVSLEMRWYRPSDVSTLRFYENAIDEAYNIASDNGQTAYMYHVKYARFFFNSTKSNIAQLPSSADYYNYSSGTWTWLKLEFDFSSGTVNAYYRDARSGDYWLPWSVDNNTFALSGDGIGAMVFEGKGNARVDDIKVTTDKGYIIADSGVVTGVISELESGAEYEWQVSPTADFEIYDTVQSGICDGSSLTYIPDTKAYVRLVTDGKATKPVYIPGYVYSEKIKLYRYGGTSNTDWPVEALSQIRSDMYAAAKVVNTTNQDKTVRIILAVYDEDNCLISVKQNTVHIPANSYHIVSTDNTLKADNCEEVRMFVIDSAEITPFGVNSIIPKW